MKKLAILGAGSWGMTLAWLACDSKDDREVWLWDIEKDHVANLLKNRTVTFPVQVTLPEKLHITNSLEEAVSGADAVVLVVTSAGTRSVVQSLKKTGVLSDKTIIVNASKGIELATLQTMSQVLTEELPKNPLAVISGPTLAPELLKGLPTASTIASENQDLCEYLQQHLSHERIFRLYTNTDVIGVELGGSLKNIFAIVSGYMQAKHLGDNARAALITRGLAEMTRFSLALGAQVQTLYGLSGLGDLLATCNSPLSRNYRVGVGLAEGKTVDQVLAEMKVVAEGVVTTHAVSQLSDKMGLDMPIVKQVESALSGNFSEEMIIKSLMSRKLKAEHASLIG